jgi:acetyltransferase-like isoleucine patch superfamily enzyme
MLIALLRHVQTKFLVWRARRFLSHGRGLHIGRGSRFWATKSIWIGDNVYIGKNVHVECNAEIGDYTLIANCVAIIGKNDHDFRAIGIPVRFSPWVGSSKHESTYADEKVVIASDVWVGFGSILLSGVTVSRGAIVAAGSVVTKDVAAYDIVAGNPARRVGQRFASAPEIEEHERRIASGRFVFSEQGYDYWIVEPGDAEHPK